MTPQGWKLLALVLAGIGLVDSAFLLYEAIFPPLELYCGIGGCQQVTSSPYSRVFGIPLALLGLLWFAAVIVIVAFFAVSWYRPLLLPLWGGGLIAVAYLVYLEAYVIGAFCTYCTIAHVLAIALGIPILKLSLGQPKQVNAST